jgi:hypothetical protein
MDPQLSATVTLVSLHEMICGRVIKGGGSLRGQRKGSLVVAFKSARSF